jgi:hypothetical protein
MNCDICQKAQATTINDGDRVCRECNVIMDNIVKQHPELAEKEPCLTCGAPVCEDALCKQQRADDLEERLYDEAEIEPLHPDYDDDGMTDMEADADALASAGWGTDEDYGYFGGDD